MMILRDKIGKFIKGTHTETEFKKGIYPKNPFKKGQASWIKGKHHSEESKLKNRLAHLGKIGYWKGKQLLEETKKKLSEAHKGKQLSEEHKLKISIGNKGRFVSEETRKKMSKNMMGNKHGWKGGINPLVSQIRNSFIYRQWRSDIFTRDNFTCQKCEQRGGSLHAHHIKSLSSILQYYEIINLEEALGCEELFNINNGVTLCEKCHKKTDSYFNYKGKIIKRG